MNEAGLTWPAWPGCAIRSGYCCRVTEIAALAAASADDEVLVAEICDLVNRAYVLAEKGMWRTGVARTTVGETVEAISRRELAVAWEHAQLVGAIRSRKLDAGTGWFGALAVDAAHGGQGV